MSDVITVNKVYKSFGGVVPANELTFRIEAGELRCLIGPNGAGKSTLFKLIVGLELSDRGTIGLFGADVTREPAFRRIRRGVGVKLQSNHAYRNLDVAHNIRVADSHLGKLLTSQKAAGGAAQGTAIGVGVTRQKALSMFGISDIVRSNPLVSSLSYAQQQWLEICCTITPGIGLLLLDEPTAGMSVEETMLTAQAVKDLNHAGLTIVVVEHDMAFVRAVADKVTVLHQGELLAEGSMAEISDRPDVRDVYLGRRKR